MPRRTLRMPDGESFSFDWDDSRDGKLTKRKVLDLYETSKLPKEPARTEPVDDRYWFNRPLTTAPTRVGQSLGSVFKERRQTMENPALAALTGFYEGASEAAGDVLSQMTAPLDIAATALGARSLKTLPVLGRNLANVGRSLTGARGLYNLVAGANLDEPETNLTDLITGVERRESGPDIGQMGAGALELALSIAPGPKPRIKGALRTEAPTSTATRIANTVPEPPKKPGIIKTGDALRAVRPGDYGVRAADIDPSGLSIPDRLRGPSTNQIVMDALLPSSIRNKVLANEPIPVNSLDNISPIVPDAVSPKAKPVKKAKPIKIPKTEKKNIAAAEKALGEFRATVQGFIDTARNAGMPEARITEIVKKKFPSFLKDESGSVSIDLLTGKWKKTPEKSITETLPEFAPVGEEGKFNLGRRDIESNIPTSDIEPVGLSESIDRAFQNVGRTAAQVERTKNTGIRYMNNRELQSLRSKADEYRTSAAELRDISPLDIRGERGSVRADMFKALGEGAKKGLDWLAPAIKSDVPEIQEAVAQTMIARSKRPKPTAPTKLVSRSFKRDVVNPLTMSGVKELETLGPTGVQASRLMQRVRAEGATEGGNRIASLKKTIEHDLNLSKEEIENLADVAEGTRLPMNERVENAFKEYRAVTDETMKAAQEAGLKLRLPSGKRIPFKGRENYWAHVFPLEMFKGKQRESLFNQLIEKGKSPKEARAIIEGAEEYGGRLIDPQHARTLDLPGYRKDIQSQYTYLEDMWKRITEARLLGPDDEHINALANKSSNPEYAHEVIGQQLGRIKGKHPALEHYVNLANTAEVALKLPFFAISNMSQVTAPLLKSSVRDFAKGLQSSIFQHKDAKLRAEATGALQAVYKMLYRDVAGEGKISKAYLMRPSEEINRTIASETGRFSAESTFASLKKNPNDAMARKRLEDLLVEDVDNVLKQDSLTLKQKDIAGFRMSELTQGLTEPMDLPRHWNAHPLFKFPQLFRRYAFQQSKIIKDAILENPKQNIPKVLALYAAMGEGIGDIKAGANALLGGEDVEERITRRGENSFAAEITKEITDDESLQFWAGRLADNLSNAFAFGLIGDALDSAFSGKPSGFIELISGVFPGDVSKLTAAAGRSVKQREMKPLIKTALETSPFGRGISKRIYPD